MKKVLSLLLVVLLLTITLTLSACIIDIPVTTTTTTTLPDDEPDDPPVHEHSYNAVVTEPTCTTKGYTTYTCECGDSYVDDEVRKLDHEREAIVTEPTCTKEGYTTHTCRLCGDSYVDGETPAKGHTYDAVVTAPTCVDEGYTTYTCHCGYSEIDRYTDPLGHEFVEWEKVREATIDEYGLLESICSRCHDAKETETTPKKTKGLEYKLINAGTSYAVIGRGSAEDWVIRIPHTHNGLPVIAIAEHAFQYGDFRHGFEIPDSVTSINAYAFYRTVLEDIIIPNSVLGIGNYAFAESTVKYIRISNSVRAIGDYAFYSCISLRSIYFDGTVEQWNAIHKGGWWNFNVPATEVICSDGTVPLK